MKQKLLKTFLLAVGLLVGANAWAVTNLSSWTGIVGATDNSSGFDVLGSKSIPLAAGEQYVITFVNYNKGAEGTDYWENWAFASNVLYCRADHGASNPFWGSATNVNYTGNSWSDIYTTNQQWLKAYNGVTVTLTVSRNATGDGITVAHTATTNTVDDKASQTYAGTFTATVNTADEINFYLTVEDAHIDITKVSYTDASSNTYSTAIESLPYTRTWATGQKSFPFNAGEAKTGTNITAWSKNSDSNTTAYAYFDSDPGTNGNQAYSLSENETVTLSYTAYQGWLSGNKKATIKLLNSDGVSLAEYEYDSGGNVTAVKFNGTTATGFSAFSGVSKYNTNNANGFTGNGKPFVTTANYNPTVTFTVSDNGYVTFTLASENAGTQSFNATLPTSGGSAVKMDLASICVVDNISNSDRALGINNLSITSAIAAKYTITFTYEDTDGNSLSALKANSSTQAVAGTTIESLISAAMQSSFYNGDASTRYDYSTFAADGDATTVPASDISVKLKFAPKAKFTRNVQAVEKDNTSNILKADLVSGYAYAGDNLKLHWNKYIYANSKWYGTTTLTGTYTASGTSDIEFSQSDIDYFFEFENLTKSGSFAATQDGDDLSNNNSARFSANSRAWTTAIAAGTYTLNIYCYGTNAKTPTLPLYYCDTDGSNRVYIGEATAASASSWALKEKTGIVIPEGKALCFYNTDGSNNSNYLVDYFTLKRTSDATVSATITDAGWSTFASTYPLDLSSLTASTGDVTAYYASDATGSTVTLAETTATVPAGEGIMLKGTAGATITIPVAASGTAISGNLLKGQTTTGTVDASNKGDNGKYHYVFGYSKSDASVFGFYNLGADTEVAAGKAYLETTTALTAGARIAIVFDDNDATAISEAKSQLPTANSQFFDLQGRRVAQPTKGLYIVNGKKVIIK